MTPEPTTRRRFLALSGVATTTGFAGCSALRDTSDPDDDSNGNGENDDEDENDDNETEPGNGNGDDPGNGNGEQDPEEESDGLELALETEFRSREEYRQPGDSFDDFEDFSAWTAVQGSAEVDEDVVFDGSQSLKLSASGDQNVIIRRDLDEEAVDLTNRDFSFALRTTTPGNIAVYLRFVDIYNSERVYQLRSIAYRSSDVGWFRTNPGVFEDSEVPTEMDLLDRIELIVLNTGPEAEVWVDDLRTHDKPDSGYVMLVWDDGHRDFYDVASPMHDEFGFNAVQSVVYQWTRNGRDDVMTRSEILDRQEAGDLIIAHGTHQPFADYDRETLEESLEEDKQWAINSGFEGGHFITYPHNSFDATSLDVISNYYYAGGFNQSGDVNLTGVYGYDPLVLPRTIGHDLDIAKRCVDLAAKHNNCTILNFHAFDQDNTMPEEEYEELLAYIDEKGGDIEVITFDELWKMRMDGH